MFINTITPREAPRVIRGPSHLLAGDRPWWEGHTECGLTLPRFGFSLLVYPNPQTSLCGDCFPIGDPKEIDQ